MSKKIKEQMKNKKNKKKLNNKIFRLMNNKMKACLKPNKWIYSLIMKVKNPKKRKRQKK